MVKKLLKYEWLSFAKTLLPMELILLGMSVLTRFIQLFETDTRVYSIVSVSSIVAFCIACVVCLVMTEVVNVVRFYRNLYTAEGYLSFTLPVSIDQHLFAKLITAVLTTVLSVISVLAAIAIATAGEVFGEVVKAGGYLLRKLVATAHWQTLFMALEALILVIVALAAQYLLFYACATLGQTAKKVRVLAAFGYYFAYYVITQILGTVLIVAVTLCSYTAWFARLTERLSRFVLLHPYASIHIGAWGVIVLVGLFGCLCYWINRTVMKKKLNLE